ncbi:MAG: hypothetical protein ACK4K2_03110, partial [Dehalococcoidia bacterium]
ALGAHLPFWERRVSLLVVSAPRGVPAALEVFRRYTVDRVVAVPSGDGLSSALPLQKGVLADLRGGLGLEVEEVTPTPVFRILWGRVVLRLKGSPWAGGGEEASMLIYRGRGPSGAYLVAMAGREMWEVPPGGWLKVTAEQGRVWVQVKPGVP